jgi:hypothetical protein
MSFSHRQLVFTMGLLALTAPVGMAQVPGTPPDQIEEDWQVVIANPDATAVGPQITTCMSPIPDPSLGFITFYLNYRDYPTWSPGGMQMKAYGPIPGPGTSAPVVDSDSSGTEVCQTPGETISWTQRMSLANGNVRYDVVNGQSTTWGSFGQGRGLDAVSLPSSLTDLSGYNPNYSVSKSGASWQANRVTTMRLLQVRYYSRGSLISTDTTPRTVALTPGS